MMIITNKMTLFNTELDCLGFLAQDAPSSSVEKIQFSQTLEIEVSLFDRVIKHIDWSLVRELVICPLEFSHEEDEEPEEDGDAYFWNEIYPHLKQHGRLEKLGLKGKCPYWVRRKIWSDLIDLTSLHSLELDELKLLLPGDARFQPIPNITSLCRRDEWFLNTDLNHLLERTPNLEHLSLFVPHLTADDVDILCNMKLKSLEIRARFTGKGYHDFMFQGQSTPNPERFSEELLDYLGYIQRFSCGYTPRIQVINDVGLTEALHSARLLVVMISPLTIPRLGQQSMLRRLHSDIFRGILKNMLYC